MRREVLTRRPQPAPPASEQFLLFRVGSETYGISVDGLWEVLPPEGISVLPTPDNQSCTALAYRGHRLPLVRLPELFGLPAPAITATARVLLTEARGRTLGILVDQVLGVVGVPVHAIGSLPVMATTLAPSLFRGVTSHGGRATLLVSAEGLGDLPEVVGFRGE